MTLKRVVVSLSLAMIAAGTANAQSRENVVCYSVKPEKKACSAAAGANAGKACADDSECPGGLCEKQPRFPKGIEAKLNDITAPTTVGEDKTFEVKKVKQLCVPVDQNGAGVDDPDTFWVTYAIKQRKAVCSAGSDNPGVGCKSAEDCPNGTCDEVAKFDKKALANVNVLLEDDLTNIRLGAGKVDLLMVPATVCSGGSDANCVAPGTFGQPPAGEQEHYKCYRAKATKSVCAVGNVNELQACGNDDDCGGVAKACVKLDKFAKGVNASSSDTSLGLHTDRAFDLAKITHLCKAVEKTALPGGTPEGPVNPKGRLVCYKSKGSKGHCDLASPSNALGACKKEENCGGTSGATTHCVAQAKYDKTNPLGQGLYVNDQFDLAPPSGPTAAGDFHRFNLNKEEMVCQPACEGFEFGGQALRAITLRIPPTGNAGDGQDVDNNPATCAPAGNCSGGIDNALGSLAGLIPGDGLNTALQAAVTNGDINIVLALSDFANGTQTVSGFTAQLDSPAGCTNINSGAQICRYSVDGATFYPKTCRPRSNIEIPVTVAGLPATPATISGGGPGSNLALNLPLFGGVPIQLTARNLKVSANIAHSAGVITTASGSLGGAVSHRELKSAIKNLPEGLCASGVNSGAACTVDTATADCGVGVSCNTNYLGGFDPPTVAGLIDVILTRDIDIDGVKTCESGDGSADNDGRVCNVDADCPVQFVVSGPACDQNDASSIGIKFTGIDALVTSAERGDCTKATCSLF